MAAEIPLVANTLVGFRHENGGTPSHLLRLEFMISDGPEAMLERYITVTFPITSLAQHLPREVGVKLRDELIKWFPLDAHEEEG